MKSTINIYKDVPVLYNNEFTIRKLEQNDLEDLLLVYSDTKALRFFNADSCDDNFYYDTLDKMQKAINFWTFAYDNGFFVRWSIVDNKTKHAIGTIEGLQKEGFGDDKHGLIRIDLRSDYEKKEVIESIMDLIIKPSFDYFDCTHIITKGFPESKERMEALQNKKFKEMKEPLFGSDNKTPFYNYYKLDK